MSDKCPENAKFSSDTRCLFCMVGFEEGFQQLSPAWDAVLAYSEDDLLHHPFTELVHPDDQDAVNTSIEHSGADSVIFSCRLRHSDGYYKELLWQMAPEKNGFCAVGIDISGYMPKLQQTADVRLHEENAMLKQRQTDLQAMLAELEHETTELKKRQPASQGMIDAMHQEKAVLDHKQIELEAMLEELQQENTVLKEKNADLTLMLEEQQ
ncbi:MAG: PAS domain-containing protein [Gammaproteobacteria bacterium]|nr:PAS domain-containing protein [Gammaproteobacteria bacterium]